MDARLNIANAVFPEELCNFLNEGDKTFKSFISFDFNRFSGRGKVWNPYANEHGYLPLGAIVRYYSRIWMVVDVFPGGYLCDNIGCTIRKNCYIFAHLNDGQYNEISVNQDFDMDGFLRTAKMMSLYSVDLNKDDVVDVLDLDYHDYIQNIKHNLNVLTGTLNGQTILVQGLASGPMISFNCRYSLFMIGNLTHCLNDGRYLVHSETEPLEMIGDTDTHTQEKWKVGYNAAWPKLSTYFSFGEKGDIVYDFVCGCYKTKGFIVDLEKSHLSHEILEKLMMSCSDRLIHGNEVFNAVFETCIPFEPKEMIFANDRP